MRTYDDEGRATYRLGPAYADDSIDWSVYGAGDDAVWLQPKWIEAGTWAPTRTYSDALEAAGELRAFLGSPWFSEYAQGVTQHIPQMIGSPDWSGAEAMGHHMARATMGQLIWLDNDTTDVIEASATDLPMPDPITAVDLPADGVVMFARAIHDLTEKVPRADKRCPVMIAGLAWTKGRARLEGTDDLYDFLMIAPLVTTRHLAIVSPSERGGHLSDAEADENYRILTSQFGRLMFAAPVSRTNAPTYQAWNRKYWTHPGSHLVRLWATLGAWLHTGVHASTDRANRSSQKRYTRAVKKAARSVDDIPTVTHVRLRRIIEDKTWDPDAPPPEHSGRTYSHRWIVRQHIRNQAVGKGRSERAPRVIGPYEKGPKDKPLIIKKQIWLVDR